MREILFRGKRKDIGKWVYGWFCPKDFEPSTFAVIDTPNIIREKDLLWCEVLPETVGQYTGLTDKNGTKIFEGDVLNHQGNVVEFCNGGFCINGDVPLAVYKNAEVIGNIHDNPEKEKGRG